MLSRPRRSGFLFVAIMAASVPCDGPTAAAADDDRATSVEAWIASQNDSGAVTNALLIERDGEILHEHYAPGYSADNPTKMYSVSKTVTAVVMGVAARQLGIDLDASVCDHLALPHPEWCQLSIEDLLRMRSGVRWSESYSSDDVQSDVLQTLYGSGATDRLSYLESLVRAKGLASDKPFVYSSGDSLLLAAISRDIVRPHGLRRWIEREVMMPLGMGPVTWEEDATGLLDAASGVFLTPPQMLRLGRLLLDDGQYNGLQLIDPGFVKALRTPKHGVAYGYQTWLNAVGSEPSGCPSFGARLFPSATPNTFAARGHFGQFVVVVPEERIIIVRTGNDRMAQADIDGLIKLVRKPQGSGESRSCGHKATVAAAKPSMAVADLPPDRAKQQELALGFAALTFCSCSEVSRLPEDVCDALATPPGLEPLSVVRLSPLVSLYESESDGRAKSAFYRNPLDMPLELVRPGCVLVDATSYPVP
jgi:CubicO group peptidase (beta-lactamase class C family)